MLKQTIPTKHAAVSLQDKLIKTSVLSSVVAGLFALILLFGISVYQTMNIQDEIMDEISDILLATDLSANSDLQVDELSDQFDIQYQLKYHNQLLTQSEDFSPQFNRPHRIYLEHDHLGLAWVEGALFRVYAIDQDQQSLKLYQPLHIRFNAVFESILSFASILLMLWLLQWLILHFAVKKQFKSILKLSRDIAEKSALDLTPIQQPEPALKELQPMVMQLNQMLARLEESLLAEQRFTSDASHELRSPLSAIQMRLQLLKRKYNQQAISADLEHIQIDVIRGSNVLNNLLLLARLDPAHTHTLPRTRFDLKDTIDEVLGSLELFSNEKNVSIDTQLNSTVIEANQELIFSCLRNVVDNAIRYTQREGAINIHLNQHKQLAIITIHNSGEKVLDEVMQRMGERFYRELGTETQGSGLGLSICKKIIELHHGTIQFKNPEQGGLTVILHLPMHFNA